jgi:intermediate cleaving peptidase 55
VLPRRITASSLCPCRRIRVEVEFIFVLIRADTTFLRPNALIIHYTSNNQMVQDDEMILMDAGCEYKSVYCSRSFHCHANILQRLRLRYQSDPNLAPHQCPILTFHSHAARTFPASGVFTEPQKDLYTAVLNAQKVLISLCTESAQLNLHELHRKSCDLLRRELNQIGFKLHTGDLERVLYPHFLSHPIGIGVCVLLSSFRYWTRSTC